MPLNELEHYARIACYIGLVLFSLFITYLWYNEKQKVYNMPRKPMKLCDKHGAYPAEMSLHIQVPAEDKEDLRVEICPQCWKERSEEAAANARK